jgi:hypothetical protein
LIEVDRKRRVVAQVNIVTSAFALIFISDSVAMNSVTVSRRHPYTSNFGPSTSSGNCHSTMDVGPYELVSERHGDIVFRPCRSSLCRGAIGRAILLCLGRTNYRDSSSHFWVSLCKRRHRFTGSMIGMRFHFCQESIPKEPV